MSDDSNSPRAGTVKAAGAASTKTASEPLFERLMSLWKGTASNGEESDDILVDGGAHERRLISNVEAFHDLTVDDLMVPRAEITAVEVSTDLGELMDFIVSHPHSRFPVYRDTLDEVVGVFHIKDLFAVMPRGDAFKLAEIVRPVPFVAPSMKAVDLLLAMRRSRNHMALVVDEFGGIDGLVTMGDLIEEIVGEIEDEHERDSFAELVENEDGSLTVDARMPIEEFEQAFGPLVADDERDEFDTVGGLIWSLAGHIPSPGEIIHHDSGAEFEVIDADQRRVKLVRARRIAGNSSQLREATA
jgi:CBS domain containing-hemolysin-like protein